MSHKESYKLILFMVINVELNLEIQLNMRVMAK